MSTLRETLGGLGFLVTMGAIACASSFGVNSCMNQKAREHIDLEKLMARPSLFMYEIEHEGKKYLVVESDLKGVVYSKYSEERDVWMRVSEDSSEHQEVSKLFYERLK